MGLSVPHPAVNLTSGFKKILRDSQPNQASVSCMNVFVSAGSTDTLAYNILHTHMSPLAVINDKLGFMFYTVMGLL